MSIEEDFLFDCIDLDNKNRSHEIQIAKAVHILRHFSFIFEAVNVDKYAMEEMRNSFLKDNTHIYERLDPSTPQKERE